MLKERIHNIMAKSYELSDEAEQMLTDVVMTHNERDSIIQMAFELQNTANEACKRAQCLNMIHSLKDDETVQIGACFIYLSEITGIIAKPSAEMLGKWSLEVTTQNGRTYDQLYAGKEGALLHKEMIEGMLEGGAE